MKRIIINADDYGVVPSINEGIIDAVTAGKVNSVAAFSNYRHSLENAQRLVQEAQTAGKSFDLGTHLTISSGEPVLEEAKNPEYGLCDRKGNFKSFTELSVDRINPDMLKKELLAQVEKFTSNGIPVRHLSCHHNTLTCFEKLFRVYVDVARETQLKMRSVNIQPSHKNNLYVKLFLGIKLRDDNDRDDIRDMRNFLKEIGEKFNEYSGNLIRTPGYLESGYYGPLPMVQIRRSALTKQIADKKAELLEIIERFGQSQTATTMELMVHLRKGDVRLWEDYDKEVKETGYKGIDPKYFDSRVAEFQSLMESDLQGILDTHKASYCTWEEL
jgi:predicted glycoside hydrolase/deacetylase ChbG (UPF0249 family)